jgi:hypothetical protein
MQLLHDFVADFCITTSWDRESITHSYFKIVYLLTFFDVENTLQQNILCVWKLAYIYNSYSSEDAIELVK